MAASESRFGRIQTGMKSAVYTLAAWLSFGLLLVPCDRLEANGFLHAKGQDIVDEDGHKMVLRGVGLGNWMLPEGYMWHFGPEGDRPRKIEKLVMDLIGPQNATRFWSEFRRQYISEK